MIKTSRSKEKLIFRLLLIKNSGKKEINYPAFISGLTRLEIIKKKNKRRYKNSSGRKQVEWFIRANIRNNAFWPIFFFSKIHLEDFPENYKEYVGGEQLIISIKYSYVSTIGLLYTS